MSAADTVLETAAGEFSDLSDTELLTQTCIRLGVALLLGALLGYDRERKDRAAGLRTHMLVAMAGALIVIAPQQAGLDHADLSRIIQGLVSGIGFLGAGAIIKLSVSGEIRGLTTAASVLMTAVLGVTAGLGRELTAICAAVLAFGVLALMPVIGSKGIGTDGKDAAADPPGPPTDPDR